MPLEWLQVGWAVFEPRKLGFHVGTLREFRYTKIGTALVRRCVQPGRQLHDQQIVVDRFEDQRFATGRQKLLADH